MPRTGYQPKQGLALRVCAVPGCTNSFVPYREDHVTCSRKCRKALYKDRHNELRRAAYKANPVAIAARNRRTHLRIHYGLTSEEVDAIAEAQDGKCALCGSSPHGKGPNGQRLHIDHDHVTGQVRAMLCTNCNGGLGKFKDDPELLRTAADYIEHHRGSVG